MLRIMLTGLIFVGWAANGLPSESEANWPRFRGPNGAGISTDKEVPVSWTATENVLWKTALPGQGSSSPIVWGDRIFLQTASDDGQQRMLFCLSATDGKILWTGSAPGTTADEINKMKKNTLASGTPATDGERVYVVFWDGRNLALHAFDFAGKHLWKRDLGSFTSQHGAGHSPMVFEDKVIVNDDQDGRAELIALDAKTGDVAWRASRPAFRSCYSTPFLLERGGLTELIVASTAGISGYDPRTGVENWVWKWTHIDKNKPLRTVASPVHAKGLIFANAGDGGGDRHMVAVRAGTKGEVSASNLAWQNTKTFPYVPTMITFDEHLYFVTDRGVAGCVQAATGEPVWTERLGGNVSASPILIDDKIYACTEEGEVHVYAASPRFKKLAQNSVGEIIFATPAVSGGKLFIRGKTHLWCVGKGNGK